MTARIQGEFLVIKYLDDTIEVIRIADGHTLEVIEGTATTLLSPLEPSDPLIDGFQFS